ncbi:MAG TPA: hydroxymethylglutaryl-CoA lyase [Gaiellaceae bacterium]|nr:hydroxymethylglutaryl-CoA lyase [Gaiellaceae bacterium]
MKVEICEVGPRDGLQNEAQTIPPDVRAELVTRLARTGVDVVEAVSFVRGDLVPQMAGAEDVLAHASTDGARLAGLVLNEHGYDRFAASGLDELHFSLGATESFNRRNANASVDESLAMFAAVAERNGRERPVVVSISVSFGCPFEGEVDPYRVLRIAEQLGGSGADAVVFADTIGVAVPRQVRSLVRQAAQLLPRVGAHFHNTRNTGFANALAAVEEGARILDASVGGLGGCPFAPKATGNIATEDLVYMLRGEGIETGVDLDALIGVAEWLEGVLGRQLPGQVYRAGAFAPVSG